MIRSLILCYQITFISKRFKKKKKKFHWCRRSHQYAPKWVLTNCSLYSAQLLEYKNRSVWKRQRILISTTLPSHIFRFVPHRLINWLAIWGFWHPHSGCQNLLIVSHFFGRWGTNLNMCNNNAVDMRILCLFHTDRFLYSKNCAL